MDTVSWFGCSIVGRLNNKINRIHERTLRIQLYIIHNGKSLWNFVIEKYKFLQGLSLPILDEVFEEWDCNYNLRSIIFLNRRGVNSIMYGTESVSFLAPKTLDTLPKEIVDSERHNTFKAKIKKWIPRERPCKTCIPQVGFIWRRK